jgi:hypothetical protein
MVLVAIPVSQWVSLWEYGLKNYLNAGGRMAPQDIFKIIRWLPVSSFKLVMVMCMAM